MNYSIALICLLFMRIFVEIHQSKSGLLDYCRSIVDTKIIYICVFCQWVYDSYAIRNIE